MSLVAQAREYVEALGLTPDHADYRGTFMGRLKDLEDKEREQAAAAERERERQAQRDHEILLRQLAAPIAPATDRVKILPPQFDPTKESIEEFFQRFSSHADAMEYTELQAVTVLYNLLPPQEQRLIDTLPSADRFKLPEIKSLLLSVDKVSPAGLRSNYYDLEPDVGDNMSRYIRRLEQAFDSWLKGCSVKASYETLRDFLLLDRAYSCLPPFIATLLRDRGCNTLETLREQGDNFLQTRPHNSLYQLCRIRPSTSVSDACPPAVNTSHISERCSSQASGIPSTPGSLSSSSNSSSTCSAGLSSTNVVIKSPHSPPSLVSIPAGIGRDQSSGKQSGVVSSLSTRNHTIPILLKADMESIKVSSGSFASLDIKPILISHVVEQGYASMSAVEQECISVLLRGSDALIKIQPGSGKPLTYILPIVNALLAKTPRVDRSDGVMAVVVVPTMDLALQTYCCLEDICRECDSIVPGYLIGGEKKNSEKNRLRHGVNILVATIGRLQNHIFTTEFLRLSNVRFFVLDEVDRMLEMGCEETIAGISEVVIDARMHGDEKRFRSKLNNAAVLDASIRKMADEDEDNEDAFQESKIKEEGTSTKRKATDEVKKEVKDGEMQPNKKSRRERRITSKMMISPCAGKCGIPLQTIMLSATFNEQVQRLARISLRNPEVIDTTGGQSLNN